VVFSTGALVHAIACAPGVHNEFINLLVTFIAAKPVDGVCLAAIVRGLAAAPGRAFVDGTFIFPIAFVADKVYFIDGHFLACCRAGGSNDGRDPLVVVTYGVDAGGTVQDHIVVLAGTTIHIGNVLAGFFATGAAVVGGGTAGAILCFTFVAELFCGVALQGEGLAGYGQRRTGIVVKGCR
jgi:hypothetical protein